MGEAKKKVCPECGGKKTLPGTCVCDSEWRGTQRGEDWEDCQCNREETCPLCMGSGFVPA